MRSHIFRPLWVVLGVIIIILIARYFVVPPDFGIFERGFMYGYHRKGNEDEWKAFKVKYRTKVYCQGCHFDRYEENISSKHGIIECENCHGPAIDHPDAPAKLEIDRSRDLCIRCHSYLPYPTSKRAEIKGINPSEHNPGMECSICHNPHKPDIGA